MYLDGEKPGPVDKTFAYEIYGSEGVVGCVATKKMRMQKS